MWWLRLVIVAVVAIGALSRSRTKLTPPIDPNWLTSDVVALGKVIREERAFSLLPILADALQDAGCDNAEILAHCRGAGPSTSESWVVDRILAATQVAARAG